MSNSKEYDDEREQRRQAGKTASEGDKKVVSIDEERKIAEQAKQEEEARKAEQQAQQQQQPQDQVDK